MSMANKVFIVSNYGMGQGNPVLGTTIMANLLRMLAESHEKPRAIFCYNEGVRLLTADSPVLAHLQELAAVGVPIQACRTCIDFFHLRDELRVGELSTMAQYVEYLHTAEIVAL